MRIVRFFHKKRKLLLITSGCIILIAFVSILFIKGYKNYKMRYEYVQDQMLDKASWFWEKGYKSEAITQYRIYLGSNETDMDAWMQLLKYYEELDNSEGIQWCYSKMQLIFDNTDAKENQIILSPKRTQIENTHCFSDFNISVTTQFATTQNMNLIVTTGNLLSDKFIDGEVYKYNKELLIDGSNKKTTEWFDISPDENSLCLYGNFNCAIWQFMSSDGEIVAYKEATGNFNKLDSHFTGNQSYTSCPIPKRAVKARVTFFDEGEFAFDTNNDVFVTYGNFPNREESFRIVIPLPEIKTNEVLTYNSLNKKWEIADENGIYPQEQLGDISFPPYSKISIDGEVCGTVVIDYTQNSTISQDGYGIRWKKTDINPFCERIGQSKNLNFGYYTGTSWIGSSDHNDFDCIKPWSEIKLCNIDKDGKITYIDDEKFSLDGSNGDVMVEIPKFYSKRCVIDDYEYLWISDEPLEGYQIEPAFITDYGTTEHIYIGAYLASASFNDIESVSGSNPLINSSYNETQKMLESKKEGVELFDIYSLSCIQKLFLVETACRNSQAIAMGVVNLSWGTTFASSSVEKSNIITLEDNNTSRKYRVGDAVTIFSVPKGESYYNQLIKYENTAEWNRIVTNVNNNGNGTINIEFSGAPLQIEQDETMIMHLPHINGEMDNFSYHTGQKTDPASGNASFTYRYIENLWGSVCVMVDDITIISNKAYLISSDSDKQEVGFDLCSQDGTTSQGVSPTDSTIKVMGYDENLPFIMLPVQVGDGASATKGWCDSWFYSTDDRELILTYGLTWDLRQYAGLFAYRANITKDESKVECGSRLIYKHT